MRALILLLSVSTLAAQQTSLVPSTESWLTGFIDVGYRWRTDVGGSFDSYRGIVDLGSGPKLLGADFTLADPKHRFFDQMHVRASNWGGDPYSTFHLDARKAKLYDFNADYRNIAYFNFSPSYADPLLARGIVLNEQSFDTHRRFASFNLDLLPGNWLIPYLAFEHDAGSGTGVTAFVSGGNEYPVPNRLHEGTSLYRGGARLELRRFHATLEEGGTTFRDDQSVYQSAGSINFGNVLTPVLGHKLDLTSLLASYGIRGTSAYSKGLFTASAASWLDLYGQFLYSQPDSDVHYQEAATGSFYLQSQLLFYSSQQYLLSASAKLPHTTASLGAEIRPLPRVRIFESWLTDRLHNASSASSSEQMRLTANYSQQEIDVFFDATSKLTLRGGYRYVWGDASQSILPVAGLASADRGRLRRNVGIGAVTFRPSHGLSMTGEVEGGFSNGAYFRTSLYNYQKVRAQARYQATASLSVSADFTLLNNQNPQPGINYDFLAHQQSLSVLWSPAGGKTWDLQGSYTRSTLRSDLGYFAPQDLSPQRSLYRENAHTATALFDVKLPSRFGVAPKLTAGGSFFISSGSRPSSYYQPLVKLWLPLGNKVAWFTDWQYYGYGEAFYLYEGFRTHLLTTGLRYTR